MSGFIRIEFYSGKDPLEYTGNNAFVVENLVVEACKYLRIGPVARHLFSLWNPAESLWYPLNKELNIQYGRVWNLYLRVRFKTPNIALLRERTDIHMLNYYFHQAHNDFMEGRIAELCHCHLRESALGLVATDIIRVLLEKKQNPETTKFNGKNFIPQILRKNPLWDNFLKEPLEKAVTRGWKNSRQNSGFVKEKYLQELMELVPDYGTEIHSVLIDEGGKVYEVELAVNPYHSSYPGLRMRIRKSKDDWTHICSMEDLCYISMRSDETIEISRQNGVPQYIQFNNKHQRHSFVSLLDGYYRLSEKWTFNLCKDLPTPSLLNLRAMKCHGPISVSFAHKKLEEKSNNEVGCYIIRECEKTYNVCYVDVWISTKSAGSENISTFKVTKDEEGLFALEGWKESFKTINQLLSHHAKENLINFQRCIPPSEYDVSNLLLCRKENQGSSSLKTRGDCSCIAQCIPHDAINFYKDIPTFEGKHTLVLQGRLRKSCTDSRMVAVKILREETKITHLQEFLSQCDKVLYWQHDVIVSTVGMVLTCPTALVMEWLPLGTLDRYIEENRMNLQEVDLVEAAYHLARALWYLEEQRVCHGNIRCHNVFVVVHNDGSFKVKLTDPGLISYTHADIHWIPPECYSDYSLASKSHLADVYAYGTTLWQIFSHGSKPLAGFSAKQAKEFYMNGNSLSFPPDCLKEIAKLVEECWLHDQDNRKQPQAIVRDVNQILYEVYNSRRSHSYAMIDPTVIPEQESSPVKPPLPIRKPPVKDSSLNLLKMFKWPVTTPFKGFSYNSLSQSKSTLNTSSANSTTTFLTEDRETLNNEPAECNSLINISLDFIYCSYKNFLGECKAENFVVLGFYAEVATAKYHQNPNSPAFEIVAVKRMKAKYPIDARAKEMHAEMKIMKSLAHKNIVQIIGLVEEPETMLVMEYVDNGSLISHLQQVKNRHELLDYSELFRFALGVAEGMEYLETQNIVHRDLAARNILIGSNDVIKITDFGLAQEIKDHYYRMQTQRELPVRWYAFEAIVSQKFSHKSDVWSYGITLWEIFSYGENPQIPKVKDIELHEALQKGQRLGVPPNCPVLVYKLMKSCWFLNSQERPSFTEIIEILKGLRSEICA
ncbi:tyrosine-protein kinase hopscotch [Trichonephila inaurata madagascariensis]|uniref:Tyrosine-protein kinase n=1 Tax=Trichonephila inaurata madagascariensis TaxID=2747483 RepID=A0A8X6XWR9_9ARAC|nr:tyrosine-protein kinase hopscotch [Trichonephila inaurata madagascariensis]